MTESDWALIERMSRGDERALAHVYDRFGTLAYSIAYHILNDAGDAEDIVAEVFMQAWTSAASFDPARAKVAGWIAMMTRSRSLDRVRARNRRSRVVTALVESSAQPSQSAPSPEVAAEESDLRARVASCLAELVPEQRQALELAYYGGLSHSEIAEALGQPLGTVKTRIRSAMGKLRESLGAYLLI
ncbi:MAG: sigma-70 family RNA polymerase sigma factor [Gemmatimonadota bacterium]